MDKKRSSNFSAMEINMLKDVVISKSHILENKKSDAVTWKAKKECWEQIALEFNSQSMNRRTADTLRKKWDNLKKNVKDKMTGQRKYALGTGGGPAMPPPNLTQDEEDIYNIIAVQAVGTSAVCDSDMDMEIKLPIISEAGGVEINISDELLDLVPEEAISTTPTLQETPKPKWSDYTPAQLRSKPSHTLQVQDSMKRYKSRPYTGSVTNKAWTELAYKKQEVAELKKENFRKKIELNNALISESQERKRLYSLQSTLLEIEIKKKREALQ